jgi:hypothetical protein
MSAGKRGRWLGLLFALAVIFGGVGAAASTDDGAAARTDATLMSSLTWDWD